MASQPLPQEPRVGPELSSALTRVATERRPVIVRRGEAEPAASDSAAGGTP